MNRAICAALSVAVACLCACESPAPDTEITPPTAPATQGPDTGSVLHAIMQRHGLDWFVADDGRWIVFPAGSDAPWLAALADMRTAGYIVQTRGDSLAVLSAGQSPVLLMPPDRGWLVLIIDDLGFRRDRAKQLIGLGVPVFMAVLPDRPHSWAIAAMVQRAGLPLMLHQPMEPQGYPDANPGAGALLHGQTRDVWRRLIERNLDGLPGVIGINNHMGSRLSREPELASVVAQIVKQRNLLLVDSLTAPDSAIYPACRAAGGRCLRRDVFLDNERNAAAIGGQIQQWLRLAEQRGLAVAIGHPYAATIEVLGKLKAELQRRQLRLIGPMRLDAWLERMNDR